MVKVSYDARNYCVNYPSVHKQNIANQDTLHLMWNPSALLKKTSGCFAIESVQCTLVVFTCPTLPVGKQNQCLSTRDHSICSNLSWATNWLLNQFHPARLQMLCVNYFRLGGFIRRASGNQMPLGILIQFVFGNIQIPYPGQYRSHRSSICWAAFYITVKGKELLLVGRPT